MYRDDLPPATLMPVPRALEAFALDHGPRSNDSSFIDLSEPLAAPPAPAISERRSRVIEYTLPFRVRVVCDEAQLQRVQSLRQAAYGHHLPALATSFGAPDPLDRLRDTTIFFVEDKETGQAVGSARVQTNLSTPLQIERSIELPSERRGEMLAEITRLCVLPGYNQPVRLALLKATHLFCIAMQISGVLAGSRRSLLRSYQALGFTDLFGNEQMVPLHHAGGLMHRVLFRDAVLSESTTRESRHPDYDFVFRAYHPDIAIFDAVAAAVAQGLQAPASEPWQRAA